FHDFERTMRLNYFAAVRLILALAPRMIEGGGGHIVNVSSMGVQTSAPEFAAYCASKAALDAFSRAVMTELGLHEPLRITTIQMGLVRTPMISPNKVYKAYPALTPAQAADMVCEAIVRRPLKISNAIGTMTEVFYAIAPEALKRFYDFGHARFQRDMARKLKKIEEAEEGA
ncbi:MAG: SDR family NAD(P)-dependent oxidoreductase, partial [Myxococcales bacterium]|nr:SDR family NAD(P)-dependent oxidoreductase [Myxococcales bacterium]